MLRKGILDHAGSILTSLLPSNVKLDKKNALVCSFQTEDVVNFAQH